MVYFDSDERKNEVGERAAFIYFIFLLLFIYVKASQEYLFILPLVRKCSTDIVDMSSHLES